MYETHGLVGEPVASVEGGKRLGHRGKGTGGDVLCTLVKLVLFWIRYFPVAASHNVEYFGFDKSLRT